MISIPFSGSKRNSYKLVKPIAENGDYNCVYEPFGGSCVLSVNLLNDAIVTRAVVNDYDHFFDEYETYLDLKDIVVEECFENGLQKVFEDKDGYFHRVGNTKERISSKLLQGKDRQVLKDIISKHVPERYWKYFALGNNFTFSAISTKKKVYLSDFCLLLGDLTTNNQRKYLKVLNKCEIDNLDWKDFLNKHKNDIDERSLLIVDPPYVGTLQRQYKGSLSFNDTVELIENLKTLECDFIFFNHNLDYIQEWLDGVNYEVYSINNTSVSAKHKREDVMIFVHKTH